METKKETEYYAVTQMGKFIKANSWEELQEILNAQNEHEIEMYVAFMYDKPHPTPTYPDKYWWPQIQIIDECKQPTTYQRGMFKVKHIFPDQGCSYFMGRKIVFENCITNQSITKYVTSNKDMESVTIADFYHSLRDILSELNKHGCEQLIKEI